MPRKKAAGSTNTAADNQTKRKETSKTVSRDRGKAAAGVHGEKVTEYRVGAAGTILEGKVYAEGDIVKLPPSQARAHMERGVRLEEQRPEKD